MITLIGRQAASQLRCSKSLCNNEGPFKCNNCRKDFCMLHLQEDRRAHRHPPSNDVQAQAYSDPHYIGFNNQNFDRHPPGDAILFRNLSIGFEIHARHEKVSETWADSPAVMKAVAIRVQSEKIEYKTDGSLMVDGTSYKLDEDGIILPKTETCIVQENTNTFHVYTTFGVKITVYNSYGYNLNITLTLPREHAQSAEPSLFGSLRGEHGRIIIPATDLIFTEQLSNTKSRPIDCEKKSNYITSDIESRAHMEAVLLRNGITHKSTRDNLLFDYLNIPVDIRDNVISENINQVKDQIKEREELITVQKLAGHNVDSFDVVESEEGYLERLEKRVSALETSTRMARRATSDIGKGLLERLEDRIAELEKHIRF